jgi:hypothetical protein
MGPQVRSQKAGGLGGVHEAIAIWQRVANRANGLRAKNRAQGVACSGGKIQLLPEIRKKILTDTIAEFTLP